MTDTVIKVENLSKRYRLGELHKQTNSFRENFIHSLRNAFSSIGRTPNVERNAQCPKPASSDDAIWALRDVSFEVKRGEIVGIIGRNGAGKSTLLKILSRITKPTEGRALITGRVGSLLEVGTGFHPELTGRENIFLNGVILGMTKTEILRKFDAIVDFAEIEKFIDTPVKRYSSGMYVRLAFSVAAHLDPEILLVDEVLAVGDLSFQKKCLGKMGDISEEGRTIIFVSHNMSAVSQLTDRCILLDIGRIVLVESTSKTIQSYIETPYNNIHMGRMPVEKFPYEKRANLDQRIRFIELGIITDNDDGLKVGQDLKIEALVESTKSIAKLCFGFTIHDEYGNSIISGMSQEFEVTSMGRRLYELVLKNLNFAPGYYQLSMSLHTGAFHENIYAYDVILNFGHFKVKNVLMEGIQIPNWNSAWGRLIHYDLDIIQKHYSRVDNHPEFI